MNNMFWNAGILLYMFTFVEFFTLQFLLGFCHDELVVCERFLLRVLVV